ncbi:hypothetical protein MSG28_015073 [Choristoneura fumiferana]|uniref:Uncharacterized protein n=1 Tax=Choristoneura fumiferana TaxID=7141 RepID=A0ACC0KZ58_CHOFU|nr:hypothetical protein MSG28_015073 [Choristoneura fumiferana]
MDFVGGRRPLQFGRSWYGHDSWPDEFDARHELGQIGALEQRPTCDAKGQFMQFHCVPTQTCFCQSEEGERLFGEVLHMGASMKERIEFLVESERDGWNVDFFSEIPECLPDGTYGRVVRRSGSKICVDERGQPIQGYEAMPGTEEFNTMNCKVLEKLETNIKRIEQDGQSKEQKHKRVIGYVMAYSVGLYVLFAILYYFKYVGRSQYWLYSVLHASPLLLLPVAKEILDKYGTPEEQSKALKPFVPTQNVPGNPCSPPPVGPAPAAAARQKPVRARQSGRLFA